MTSTSHGRFRLRSGVRRALIAIGSSAALLAGVVAAPAPSLLSVAQAEDDTPSTSDNNDNGLGKDPEGCKFLEGGVLSKSLCWLDLSSIAEKKGLTEDGLIAAARVEGGTPVHVELPNKYSMDFNLHIFDDYGQIQALQAPVWDYSVFGNTFYGEGYYEYSKPQKVGHEPKCVKPKGFTTDYRKNNFDYDKNCFSVVFNKPLNSPGSSDEILKQPSYVEITNTGAHGVNAEGQEIDLDYSFIMADAESTNEGEEIIFESDKPIKKIAVYAPEKPENYDPPKDAPPQKDFVKPCGIGEDDGNGGTYELPWGSKRISCVGQLNGANGKNYEGMIIGSTLNPQHVKVSLRSNKGSGLAIGVLMTTATGSVTVERDGDLIDSQTHFSMDIYKNGLDRQMAKPVNTTDSELYRVTSGPLLLDDKTEQSVTFKSFPNRNIGNIDAEKNSWDRTRYRPVWTCTRTFRDKTEDVTTTEISEKTKTVSRTVEGETIAGSQLTVPLYSASREDFAMAVDCSVVWKRNYFLNSALEVKKTVEGNYKDNEGVKGKTFTVDYSCAFADEKRQKDFGAAFPDIAPEGKPITGTLQLTDGEKKTAEPHEQQGTDPDTGQEVTYTISKIPGGMACKLSEQDAKIDDLAYTKTLKSGAVTSTDELTVTLPEKPEKENKVNTAKEDPKGSEAPIKDDPDTVELEKPTTTEVDVVNKYDKALPVKVTKKVDNRATGGDDIDYAFAYKCAANDAALAEAKAVDATIKANNSFELPNVAGGSHCVVYEKVTSPTGQVTWEVDSNSSKLNDFKAVGTDDDGNIIEGKTLTNGVTFTVDSGAAGDSTDYAMTATNIDVAKPVIEQPKPGDTTVTITPGPGQTFKPGDKITITIGGTPITVTVTDEDVQNGKVTIPVDKPFKGGDKIIEVTNSHNDTEVPGKPVTVVGFNPSASTLTVTKPNIPLGDDTTIVFTPIGTNGTTFVGPDMPETITVTVPGVEGPVTLNRQPDGTYTATVIPTSPVDAGKVTVNPVKDGPLAGAEKTPPADLTVRPVTPPVVSQPKVADTTVTVTPDGDKSFEEGDTVTIEVTDRDGNKVDHTHVVTSDEVTNGFIFEVGAPLIGGETIHVSNTNPFGKVADGNTVTVGIPVWDPGKTTLVVTNDDGDVVDRVKVHTPITITVTPRDKDGNIYTETDLPDTIEVSVPGVEGPVTLHRQPDGTYVGHTIPVLATNPNEDTRVTVTSGFPQKINNAPLKVYSDMPTTVVEIPAEQPTTTSTIAPTPDATSIPAVEPTPTEATETVPPVVPGDGGSSDGSSDSGSSLIPLLLIPVGIAAFFLPSLSAGPAPAPAPAPVPAPAVVEENTVMLAQTGVDDSLQLMLLVGMVLLAAGGTVMIRRRRHH